MEEGEFVDVCAPGSRARCWLAQLALLCADDSLPPGAAQPRVLPRLKEVLADTAEDAAGFLEPIAPGVRPVLLAVFWVRSCAAPRLSGPR